MILKVRDSDKRIVARFPTLADASAEAGHSLIDEATLAGTSEPGSMVEGGAIVPDPEVLTAGLLAQIDREREAAMLDVITRGVAKQLCYARKAREVTEFRALGGAAASLAHGARAVKFVFAQAEADLTGETIAQVIDRFEAGMSASMPAIARIEAKTQQAKRAVRAAPTRTAKEKPRRSAGNNAGSSAGPAAGPSVASHRNTESMNEIGLILSASVERAPWGWGLFAIVLTVVIKGWPAISDAAMRARAAMSAERRSRYESLEERIGSLETRLESTVKSLHEAEMKLVSALAAYRLVIGELQKIDPDNPVLKQAQALLNVSYPSPSDPTDAAREMVRETHAASQEHRP